MIARRAYGFYGFQSHGALISMLFLCGGGIELAPPLPTRALEEILIMMLIVARAPSPVLHSRLSAWS